MDSSRIGPFALEGRLGADNKGNVFRAVQIEQRRTVALKLFSAPLIKSSRQAREEFVNEAKLLSDLVHPHIVRCYGAGLVKMQGYLALELVEGESLRQVIDRRGKLTWDLVIDLARQICDGLYFAHETGLCHLDLMPDKLLLSEQQQIKIADFRVDRLNNGLCASSLQRTVERVSYCSPELIRGSANINHKADLYSLGCVLFEMLTGRPPFAGQSAAELAQQQMECEAPRVSSIELDCPVWLDVLVAQLLEKDPDRRPHSAAAVGLALKEAEQKIASRTGVAEHATRGFSPLRMPVDKSEASRLLGRKKESLWRRVGQQLQQADLSSIVQSAWVLGAALLLITGTFVWALWPPSEEQLFRQAEALMETDDRDQWRRARRDYLEPLLQRFPDGQHAEQAQQYLDRIEMLAAEDRLRFNARLGRTPNTEGERLYAEALRFEQFGDQATALKKYRALVQAVPSEGKNRPFVKLAERQIANLRKDSAISSDDHSQVIRDQLLRADKLAAAGELQQAQLIWQSIVALYSDEEKMQDLVSQAGARLAGKRPTSDEPSCCGDP